MGDRRLKRGASATRTGRALVAAALVALVVAPASPSAAPADARPWAAGVSAERQAGARSHFDEGNRAFEASRYGDALASYREALALWGHPMIHFNMAVCFIHLDQPAAAYEHLSRALSHGVAPLGDALHSQGLTYAKLLIGRLAQVRISCEQPGVDVRLDGRLLFTCPGSAIHVVLPGVHQIVAKKPGHLTDVRDLDLAPGRIQVESIALVPGDGRPLARRWRTWMPWAVVGSGVAVAAIGVGMRRMSVNSYGAYDREFADACPAGCVQEEIPDPVRATGRRARLENGIAVGSFAAGAALVSAGGVLLFLNQPRPVSSEEQPGTERTAGFGAVPLDHGAGVVLTLPF